MSWVWSDKARSLVLPTSTQALDVGQVALTWTQLIAFGFGVAITFGTAAFLQYTKLGTAMRGLANDREITATLGVPVRRVEASAWFVSGLLSGISGLLLANLVGLDSVTLTFLVISALAAALIARLRSLLITFGAALVVGLVSAMATPINSISEYRNMAPFVLAAIALMIISRRREISFTGTGLGNGRS
jgi:branched-chain amino acid transport system permease protein